MRFSDALVSGARELDILLDPGMVEAFEAFYRELVDFGTRMNLTAIEGEEDTAVKHFLDSLTCLVALDLDEGMRLIDIGSGAGFPGLPLKIARPGIRATLVEAVGKRVGFLEHIVTELGLSGVQVIWDRAERVGRAEEHREAYDVAVARGVADLAVLAELCLPLVRVGGVMAAQKGPRVCEELAHAAGAIETMGGRLERVTRISLPWGHGDRSLVVLRKKGRTPDRYPRRVGVPEKRPVRTADPSAGRLR